MATLKDIAARAQVSIVTVHKCIYGKPGVGAETRRRVLQLVEEMHYLSGQPPAKLKRGGICLAAVCPDMPAAQNSFFQKLQAGVGRAAAELAGEGVAVCTRLCATWQEEARALEELAGEGKVHGVAVGCLDERRLDPALEALGRRGVPVVTFNSDAPASCRLAYVAPPAQRMGALAAELLCKLERAHRRLLVVGGDKRLSILRENTTGFYGYIQRHHPEVSLLEINNAHSRDLRQELAKVLASLGDISGVYCSMTRNGLLVCETLRALGLQRRVRLVCTDVFPDLWPYLQDGTVDATLWQDPTAQGHHALLLLYHYLLGGRLGEEYFHIPIAPVFCSNFEDYL